MAMGVSEANNAAKYSRKPRNCSWLASSVSAGGGGREAHAVWVILYFSGLLRPQFHEDLNGP
jgi:hypothetical protein